MKPLGPDRDFLAVFVMLAVLAAAAAIALSTVSVPVPLPDVARAPLASRWGYTASLALFFLPSATIAVWFARARGYAIERKAFGTAAGVGFAFGCLLDVGFAHEFFEFRNAQATLGITLPGFVAGRGFVRFIPIEEFLFYALGFTTILLLYSWTNLYWLGAYQGDDLKGRAGRVRRLVRPHAASLVVALVVLAAGYAYRYLGPARHHTGFPGYFTYLVLVGALPSLLFLPEVKPIVNWRALSFTLFVVLFISLLWEVTLGVPYAWWGYRDHAMLGLFIRAWGNLPIEAVLVWVSACYGSVIVFETIRLFHYSGRPPREAFFGSR